jgi:hypothetical protein
MMDGTKKQRCSSCCHWHRMSGRQGTCRRFELGHAVITKEGRTETRPILTKYNDVCVYWEER